MGLYPVIFLSFTVQPNLLAGLIIEIETILEERHFIRFIFFAFIQSGIILEKVVPSWWGPRISVFTFGSIHTEGLFSN